MIPADKAIQIFDEAKNRQHKQAFRPRPTAPEERSSSSHARRDHREVLSSAPDHCPCSITIIMVNTSDITRGKAIRVRCKTKGCEYCGPLYCQSKIDHFSKLVAGKVIYRAVIDSVEWKAMGKRHSVTKAKYIRVPVAEDRYIVLSTEPIGEEVDDPVEAVTSAFAAMVVDRRRVSSSRNWAEPKAEKTSGDWQLLGFTKHALNVVRKGLERLSVLGAPISTKREVGWFFTFPDEVADPSGSRMVDDFIYVDCRLIQPGLPMAA